MGDKSCIRAASIYGGTSASLRITFRSHEKRSVNCGIIGGVRNLLTDPMARKNENVAALLSMYWESVARKPRGPGPALLERGHCSLFRISTL
jgi:hypothetical protein